MGNTQQIESYETKIEEIASSPSSSVTYKCTVLDQDVSPVSTTNSVKSAGTKLLITQQNMLSITSELTATSTVSSEEASSAIDGFSAAINSKSDELDQHMVQNNNMAVTSVGPIIIITSSPSLSLKPSFIPSSSPSLKPSSISSSSPSLKPSSNFPSYVPSITAIPSKKPKNVNKAKPKKNKKKKSKKSKKTKKPEKK